MSEPNTGRRFAETLDAALARSTAHGTGEPAEAAQAPAGEAPVARAGASPVGREFTQTLQHVLAPGPASEPDDAASATEPREFRRFEEILGGGFEAASEASGGGLARATEESGWITEICPVCRHSFRQGDMVWLDGPVDRMRPVHESPGLPCHSGSSSGESQAPVAAPVVAAFADAVRLAYRGIPGVVVKRLLPGHPLLSGQYRERARCAGCNHTFRPFERVAFCPCSPGAPACRLAAHRDPAASLLCYDALADPQRKHCPMDYHKLAERSHG